MILTRIVIENYKQYRGSNEIEIPSQATIGVIGENGAGKTTLFEAIEWCLYSPRAISPHDVRPRGETGPTTVAVYLESVDGSQQFIVERVLKRTPSATVYRVDELGEPQPLVQGTRQVSDYVATKLIGLSHTAFTATFFTRQQELHLFGDQAPGKRREEIGRLLGLETIRIAQKRFAAERTKAAAEAKAMTIQYEREAQGRDFAQELHAADEAISCNSRRLAASLESAAAAHTALDQRERALAAVQERREQDATLAQQLAELGREREALAARQRQIAGDLEQVAQRATERARLAPLAAQAPALAKQLQELERERSRHERALELDRTCRGIEQRRRDLNGTVRSTVEGVRVGVTIDGWLWASDDAVSPVQGVSRLHAVLEKLDIHAAEQREVALKAARQAAENDRQAQLVLKRYLDERRRIDEELGSLLTGGEPRDALPQLDRERDSLLEERTRLHARRTALEADRDHARVIIQNLDHRHFGEDCPTCGRPFSEADATVVQAAMRQREAAMSREINEIITASAGVERDIARVDQDRKDIFARIEKVDAVRQRIEKSVSHIEGRQEEAEATARALADAVAAVGLAGPPSPDEIATAEVTLRHLRQVEGTRPALDSALRMFRSLQHDEEQAVAERQELGEVLFDAAAYQHAAAALNQAERARAVIREIDRDLARQPALEAEQATGATRQKDLVDTLGGLAAQRTALAYDPASLADAQAALHEARAAERQALDERHRSQSALREAELRREAVAREQDRLQKLAIAADAMRSEADHIELMAREFTEFERYAAARKVPLLGDYTSELVRAITDGRYERVEFDQDFGIVVFDGDDSESSYPVDTFSGGERDAITLSARIALSQMIGRQAANPPGFLVLDEVFGSLDSDRRGHLLDLLGTITGTFDALRQVFIISHVDDVRTSPVLDELWRIEATEDGSSQVTSLQPGAEIDTL